MEAIQQKNTVGKNLPERKFRAGPITATVWANESVNKEGQAVSYRTVSFERSYKNQNDEWQTTSSLRMNDLPKAILVLTKAYESLSLSDTVSEGEA